MTLPSSSMPEWVVNGDWVDPIHCEKVEKALAIAIEALENIANNDLTTWDYKRYRAVDAMRGIEALGKAGGDK